MPTYVYRRPDGTTFEVFQKISDAALTEDPTSGVPVSRVISGGAGLQFKGEGFYITDYVKKSGTPDATGPGKDNGSSKAKGKGTSETKKPAVASTETTTASTSKGSSPSGSSSGDS
jgi:predicted nucleic acid-binding Zn ribbon protein